MRLEIDIPEHHYNNIMALDSVSLGRVPYKGIIMYAINAIKHGKVLEQEPTTKNDLSSGTRKNSKKLEKDFGELDCISRIEDAVNRPVRQRTRGYRPSGAKMVEPQESEE